jgi:hypothetical protein
MNVVMEHEYPVYCDILGASVLRHKNVVFPSHGKHFAHMPVEYLLVYRKFFSLFDCDSASRLLAKVKFLMYSVVPCLVLLITTQLHAASTG